MNQEPEVIEGVVKYDSWDDDYYISCKEYNCDFKMMLPEIGATVKITVETIDPNNKKKPYTLIWEDVWRSGSIHKLVKKTFINFDASNGFDKVVELYQNPIYIFEGHVTTLGEEVSDVEEI